MAIHAIILAGGRSSRLHDSAPATVAGAVPDKLFLQRADNGERLIDAVFAATARCERRVVVGPAMDVPPGVARVQEDPPFAGPAAAIATGLAAMDAADDDSVLILAADMPTPDVEALVNATLSGDGLIAVADGRSQPLLCRLKFGSARTAFAGVTGGSAMRCLDELELTPVQVDASAAADVDTWQDAEAAGLGVQQGPVSWFVARERAASAGALLGANRAVECAPAVGLRLAQDAVTPMPIPHYTSSAMDGFAVAGDGPWQLLAPVAEGAQGRNIHRTGGTLEDGQALPILTGSVLPDGTTAIVRSEHSTVEDTPDGDVVALLAGQELRPGADIRHEGEELSPGDVLVTAGTELGARHLPLLAACGVDTVVADRPIVVDCAFTGNEVITSGVPGPGEVRDAFSDSFPALIAGMGAHVGRVDRLADSPDDVHDWLTASTADIVLVTGGSGHSSQDFARIFITQLADTILAESVHCQPGHPTLIASRTVVHDDQTTRPQLIIGVPGNPLAAHVALHSFAAPALAAANGNEFPAVCACQLSGEFKAIKRYRVRLVPARLSADGIAQAQDRTNSHMLSGYAHANCLLVVPPGGVIDGDLLNYLPL